MNPFKILVVTTWAPPMIGGPQNLYNLFSQFPEDSYVILTSTYRIDHRSGTTGTWLPGKYVFYDREGGWTPEVAKSLPGNGGKSFKQRVAEWLGKIPLVGGTLIDIPVLWKEVAGFVVAALRITRTTPVRLLVGISDTGAALIATYLVHKVTKLPYAVYLFDLYRGNRLRPFHRFLARFVEPRLLRHAAVIILTNEETEKSLRRRYKIFFRSEVIRNSVFPDAFDLFRTPYDPKPPYVVLFTGNVYWAQEGALLNLIHAMDRLRDLPVRLDLYIPNVSASIREAVSGKPNVRLSSAPPSEMPRIQCGATLLFLPLAWTAEGRDIIETATPGKLSDYLASGRPMLVHAPDYSYVVRCTEEDGTGIVVDQDDVAVLADAIRKFLREPVSGRQYVENGLRIFERHHDARINARRLWAILCQAAGCEPTSIFPSHRSD